MIRQLTPLLLMILGLAPPGPFGPLPPLSAQRPARETQALPGPSNHHTPYPLSPLNLAHPSLADRAAALVEAKLPRSPHTLKSLQASLDRGHLFRREMAAEILRRRLPPELLYLPLVESAYRPRAVSRAGAAGLWQFMPRTAEARGLRITPWLDDRLDFRLATPAALDELEQNYRATGDWLLALAAYNAGLGRILRTIENTGIRDYWQLRAEGRLPRETSSYVPDFLALAHIAGHPGRFGLRASWEEAPRWAELPLNQPLALEDLARAAGIPGDLLEAGNSALRQGRTPPPEESYRLKVPESYRRAVSQALAEMTDKTDLDIPFDSPYEVKKGDSLWSIARAYRVSPLTMAQKNNMEIKGALFPGMILLVPGRPGEEISEGEKL